MTKINVLQLIKEKAEKQTRQHQAKIVQIAGKK